MNTFAAPHTTARDADALLGDARALAAQLGSPATLAETTGPATAFSPAAPTKVAALRDFLASYERDVLQAQEWPAIQRAWQLAGEGRWRELVALDLAWGADAARRPFAEASCRVGQRQLGRLRPLRDHRVVQRYAAAVEAGEARGWHVLVYGVALAVFGIPLRQGLLNYAEQTLGGFIDGAPISARLTEGEKDALFAEVEHSLPAALNRLLPADAGLTVA